MLKDSYFVSVTILEARNLMSDGQNAVNPFVRIRIGQESQVTTTQYRMNTVTWNQQFSFNSVMLDPNEFENGEILIEVWDAQGFDPLAFARGA